MKPALLTASAATLLTVALASPVLAQREHPVGSGAAGRRRPTISPYLDLLQGPDSGIGFQYLRRVRPEQRFRQENADLSRSVYDLQRRQERAFNQQQAPRIGTTGHPSAFFNYSHYYQMPGGGSRRGIGRRAR